MNNFKVTVDGTYTVNFMDQVLTVKVKDGVAISRESELETKLSIAVSALKCNETFHRLGGIDDCEPCQALEKLRADTSR